MPRLFCSDVFVPILYLFLVMKWSRKSQWKNRLSQVPPLSGKCPLTRPFPSDSTCTPTPPPLHCIKLNMTMQKSSVISKFFRTDESALESKKNNFLFPLEFFRNNYQSILSSESRVKRNFNANPGQLNVCFPSTTKATTVREGKKQSPSFLSQQNGFGNAKDGSSYRFLKI